MLGDTLYVVADGDVWAAPVAGGRGHRLTDGRTAAAHPLPSPDGSVLAFTATEEGHAEVFTMPLTGGPATRLTHLGATTCVPRAWQDDTTLLLSANGRLPFARDSQILRHGLGDAESTPAGWGTAHEVAVASGRTLIGRNTTNQGRWKRYRGGTAGQLWLDPGDGEFTRLLPDLEGDIGSPMLIGDRVWFIADHEGVGNLYSVGVDGQDLIRHTDHADYYARFAHTDGQTITYTVGGDVWRLDPASDAAPTRVVVELGAPRVERGRRFVDPKRWMQSYAVHPRGTHLAVRVRGRPFTMPLFDGAPAQLGSRDGVNHRLIEWLPDGRRVVLLADTDDEERLEVHDTTDGSVHGLPDLHLGVVMEIAPHPREDRVALVDQMGHLRVVDLASGDVTDVAHSPHGVDHPRWSPDGCWLAWSHRESNWYTASIRLWEADTGQTATVAEGRLANRAPDWDPSGRFLYWIAGARLHAVPDGVVFDRGFPHPDLVMAAVLSEEGVGPLDRDPHPPGGRPPAPARAAKPSAPDPGDDGDADPDDSDDPDDPDDPDEPPEPDDGGPVDDQDGADASIDEDEEDDDDHDEGATNADRGPRMRVDLEGIHDRVVPLPFPAGRYHAVTGLRGKVLALATPLRPPPLKPPPPGQQRPAGVLEMLSLATGKVEVLLPQVSSYDVSQDRSTMVYAVRRALRAVRAGVKPPDARPDTPARESGRIDLGRLSVAVSPPEEWRQILMEGWRLQRELFWHTEMSGVDWDAVRDRYVALVDRLASRADLSDLMWEMFGELGTGHAYVRGGDHPPSPRAPLGHLGADVALDEDGWSVRRVLEGDPTLHSRRQPLRAPGVRVSDGARLLAVDGVDLDASTSPAHLLVNRAEREVSLRVADPEPRTVTITPLRAETPLRYHDWVTRNRREVHDATGGRVGYVHIPDMGLTGYAEFTRQYLSEVYRDALVVDVRFNGGGNVSSLILEALSGQRVAYQLRRTGAVEPHPHHAPAGPLVAITNERCGSDGDVFAHVWRRLDLGPVVGTRTWGGVIGIQPRLSAADGTVTTQPGFAFWFDDVGFTVENRGVDPTHPVEIAPHDALAGQDPQLATAIELVQEALEAHPPQRLPNIADAPDLSPEPFPPRDRT